jgi:hypothetical protein
MDRALRAYFLPAQQAIPLLREQALLWKSWTEKSPELSETIVSSSFFAAAVAVWSLQRRIDAQRIVEALRDHAARHEGSLPASLDELELPVPLDVLTGKPFDYRLEEGAALLSTAPIEMSDGIERYGIRYRIRCR